jgi:tetratricopeptide (TPR) repeat protein
MKKIIGLIGICAALLMFALPAFARSTEPAMTLAQAQGQCTDENKTAWYTDFTKFRTTDPAKAYEAGKKYLAACPAEDTDITKYLKKWVGLYDKEARKLRLQPLLYEKKYAEAYQLGKEILADEPDNLRVMIDLGYAGYVVLATTKNESFNADALNYAKKAIQMIESGKTVENWAPFKSKDDALAYLYYTVGYLNRANPSEALGSFIKSAQFESELKRDPLTYYLIAAGYEGGLYAKLSADYKAKFEGKDETPESKLALENINQVIDRMIDAYARAVSLAGTNPKHEAAKKEWMENLETWYKYRHNQSTAGLTEMVASIMSKPLPPVPTPLTSLPAAAPGASSGVGASTGTATGTASAPAGNSGATAENAAKTSGATQNAAKPAGTNRTSNTRGAARPKRNH